MQRRHGITGFWRPLREVRRESHTIVWVAFALLSSLISVAEERIRVDLRTGTQFRRIIEQPFSRSWSNVELRHLLKVVAAEREVSIVLDRRLDSSVEFPLNIANVSLETSLIGIAKRAGGDAIVLENAIYLGPKSATRILRTLIELRNLNIESKEIGIANKRRKELREHRTFAWADLETPRTVLEMIAHRARINVSNPDIIPHDLWAETALPDVTVSAALSIVLIQFDLTYRWTDPGSTIELIPIPEVVFIERKHRPKQRLNDAIALIRDRFPTVEAEISKSEIAVKGTLEDHEAISSLLRGEGPRPPIKIEPPQPIQSRQFSLKAVRVPLIAIMKNLEESAISFEYDADELKAAGIDLEKPVQIEVNDLSAAEFFKLLFDPIGLDFEIDRMTVKLVPKKKEREERIEKKRKEE